MNSTELNKIAAAAIGALLVFLLLNFFSGLIYGTRGTQEVVEGEEGPVLAYAVEIEAAEGATGEEEPQIDVHAVMAAADPAAGEGQFRACGACHSVEPGENKVGPSLHDVVGRDIAAIEGFAYSDAMAAMEGGWTPALLFDFLGNPKGVVPGTKMNYAGIGDLADRANLIAYLNEIGGSPVDLTEGIEPLAPAGDAAEAGAETEVAASGDDAAAPATGGGAAADAGASTDAAEGAVSGGPGEDQGEGAVTGEAPAAVTPESATETTTSAMPPAQPDVTVTDVETVDVGEENVEVGSTTPLEVEESVPSPAASEEAGPAEQPVTGAPAADAPAEGEGEQVAAAPADGGAALAGDPAAGERIFRRCQACHRLEEGRNMVGPSLHGVVGRDIASVEGFNYSDALAAQEGAWTPELLSQFIADPKGTIPGNKMAFAGVPDEQDRIDVITFIQQAAESPAD